MRRAAIVCVVIAIGLGYFQLRSPQDDLLHELSGYTMGTMYHIKVVDMPAQLSETSFADHIAELLHNLDREVMSTFAPDSELSRFNQAPINQLVTVSKELAYVVDLALEIGRLSDGAFDITVGPLVNLWGFGPEGERINVPSEEEIIAARRTVGRSYLQVIKDPPSLLKTSEIYVDLSGIAKGFAVDQVAQYFDTVGIENYFIELGGELKIKGNKPAGKSWVPAIEKPIDTAAQVHKIFYVSGEAIAVAGSGNYRNYFEKDGVRYSHEIDPGTGRPIAHRLAAAYVIDESAARADALATAFMVMGREKAFELAQQLGLAAWFISKNSTEEGFSDNYTQQFSHFLVDPLESN